MSVLEKLKLVLEIIKILVDLAKHCWPRKKQPPEPEPSSSPNEEPPRNDVAP